MTAITNRYEILFIYEAKDCNPNGDPLDENRPRTDPETGEATISDVRIKRTVRDLTARGFIALDASDKDGRMLRLTEAGMAVACDRAANPEAPEVVSALEFDALQEMSRCRAQRSGFGRLN